MSNGIERNVNIEIVREDIDEDRLNEPSELGTGSGEDALSEAFTDSAPVVPPPAKKTRWTKKKQELAKKAEMEALGIQQKLPLTALSRRELRDMGLDTSTIIHIRNQAKRLNDMRKAEIDTEAEMASLEVQKKQLALEQEKARVAELMMELERAKNALKAQQPVYQTQHQYQQPTYAPRQQLHQAPEYTQPPPSQPVHPAQPMKSAPIPQPPRKQAIDAQSLFY